MGTLGQTCREQILATSTFGFIFSVLTLGKDQKLKNVKEP
jgi:hypothetical protein